MKFIAIVLLIVGLIFGWFRLQEKRAENRAMAWAAQLAPHLADQPLSSDPALAFKKTEANFYWILYYFDKLITEGMNPSTVLGDACNQINMPGEKAALFSKNLLANYDTAKKYRIYEDITNVVKLEQGESPLMKMSGWEDEPAVMGYIIPPHLSPEAAASLANFALMPSIVSDAQSGQISPNILEQARAMERAKIITKTSLEGIVTLFKNSGP